MPATSPAVREEVIDTGSIRLSGLVAEPETDPRGLIVAIHGAGMHAGYFDRPIDPQLSLFELARTLGFTVWAPDRPGVGASSGLSAELGFAEQSDVLFDALEVFKSRHATGGGAIVLAHSFGLKVALTMAASDRSRALLGLDGSGTGFRYNDAFLRERDARARRELPATGNFWGPDFLYPAGTIDRAQLPISARTAEPATTFEDWPGFFATIAPRIRIPVRISFGEYERFWATDPASIEELRNLLSASVDARVRVHPNAGHNISLGWSARSYHLGALAFAEECLLRSSIG